MNNERARKVLHTPRQDGSVGPWRAGDRIETQEQADLLQSILEGRLQVEPVPGEHPDLMRLFQLTMNVYLPSHAPLPDTFTDWIGLAFGIDTTELPASPTTLTSVVELRYRLADDVVEKRRERKDGGPWW